MPPIPRQKISRNDPCPCGSGKKHKHCCLKNEANKADDTWWRQHEASAQLAQKLQKFALEHLAAEVPAAWSDFNQQEEPPSLEDDPNEGQIFIPYFVYDWKPRPDSRGRPPTPGVVAQSFLRLEGARLPELERLIFEQASTQPLTFYEVVRCRPGDGVAVRDILLGGEGEIEVTERTASRLLQPGDMAYGQLCELPGLTTFGRLAPLAIPPQKKPSIVELRTRLRKKIAKQNRPLTVADLILNRDDIRTKYLDVRDAMRTPPVLTNTDGDLFLLHTLTFRTASAFAAFEALAPLAWGISKKELLQRATMDANGALEAMEIPWVKKGNRFHKDWDTTLLGTINISGRSLVAHENSERRAIRKQKSRRWILQSSLRRAAPRARPMQERSLPILQMPLLPRSCSWNFSNKSRTGFTRRCPHSAAALRCRLSKIRREEN